VTLCVHMPLTSSAWHCSGMHFMMQSGRVMETGLCVTGSSCQLFFDKKGHYNYADEAVNLLTQTIVLSPRKVSEIKRSWTVNTTGRVGKNIPVDLHMEHSNRRLKIMMRNLGSNISPNSVKHSSKTLGTIE